jgi:hypothetical protein
MKSCRVSELGTDEIKEMLKVADVDFDIVVNKALNSYLPKILLVCPFTDKYCVHEKQCIGCSSSNTAKL